MKPSLISLLAAGALATGCAAPAAGLPPEALAPRAPGKAALPPPSTGKTLDLSTALRLASGSHLDILEARARAREAEGRASSADGYLLPVIGAGAAVGNTRGTAQSSFGELKEVNFNTMTALGTVRISANVGESIYRDLAAHRAAEAASEYELAQVQRTLLEVSVEYLALVESDAAVRIQEQFVQESQTLARLTQARETQGLGSALDSERARAQAAAAEQRLIGARNERQRRSKLLSTSLRLDATVDLVPADTDLSPASLVNPNEELARWLDRARQHRPEVTALQSSVDAFRQEASATRWSVWGPELAAGAAFGVLGKSAGTLDDRDNYLVTLGWTFSFGGPGRIEAADARSQQADLALQKFQDRLQGSVAAAHQEMLLSRQQLDPAQRELTAAENALRIARATYEGGLLPENDLLLAQQGADQARLRRLAAVARFNQSQLQLLAESGIASIDSLSGGAAPK
jgi:outer membrane protein TolC